MNLFFCTEDFEDVTLTSGLANFRTLANFYHLASARYTKFHPVQNWSKVRF